MSSLKKAGSGRSPLRARDFWLTLGLVWSASHWLTLALIGLEILNGFLPAWLTMLGKSLIDTLLLEVHTQDLRPIVQLTVLIVGGWIFNHLLDIWSEIVVQRLKEEADWKVTSRVATKVTTLDLEQVESAEFQNLLALASQTRGSAPMEAVHYLAVAIAKRVEPLVGMSLADDGARAHHLPALASGVTGSTDLIQPAKGRGSSSV